MRATHRFVYMRNDTNMRDLLSMSHTFWVGSTKVYLERSFPRTRRATSIQAENAWKRRREDAAMDAEPNKRHQGAESNSAQPPAIHPEVAQFMLQTNEFMTTIPNRIDTIEQNQGDTKATASRALSQSSNNSKRMDGIAESNYLMQNQVTNMEASIGRSVDHKLAHHRSQVSDEISHTVKKTVKAEVSEEVKIQVSALESRLNKQLDEKEGRAKEQRKRSAKADKARDERVALLAESFAIDVPGLATRIQDMEAHNVETTSILKTLQKRQPSSSHSS